MSLETFVLVVSMVAIAGLVARIDRTLAKVNRNLEQIAAALGEKR